MFIPSEPKKPEKPKKESRDFLGGLLLVGILHILFIASILLLAFSMAKPSVYIPNASSGSVTYEQLIIPFAIANIWIIQFFYLWPFMIWFAVRRRREVSKGITVGIILTLFINIGTCFSGAVAGSIAGFSALTGLVFLAMVIGLIGLGVQYVRSQMK